MIHSFSVSGAESVAYRLAAGARADVTSFDAVRARPPAPFSLSVVIPLYNKENPVEATLRSVIHQTRPPDEIIIVDDGSTDNSLAAAKRVIQSEQSRIPVRLIEQRNQGVSLARNRGAAEAKSEYIAFLDADDEWQPECAAELERLSQAFPESSVLTVRFARIRDGKLRPGMSALPPDFFGELASPLTSYRKGYGIIHSSSVAIKRDAWRRSEGFPAGARRGEDICCWLKLMMSERVAHSGRALTIRHDEHSAAAERKGVVPHHLSYFLGTDDGRRYMSNRALARFLAFNLAVQIGGLRLAGDEEVVGELRKLSSALPVHYRGPSLATAHAPKWLLRRAIAWRRGRRIRFQSMSQFESAY